MDDTDHIAIIELGPDDAMAAHALSAEAHWNQNEADFRFFISKGTVFGVRDNAGHPVATAALLPYTSGNAWISMVLVTAKWFITCDISAMGFDRRDLLRELAGRPRSQLVSNGDAMALIRDGRTARHIGPLFADTPDRALALVQEIVRSERGPLLIDAVATQDAFLKGLTENGWTVERPFQRMRFGNDNANDNASATEPPFAVAGPEYG
jgi:hypothetical protein